MKRLLVKACRIFSNCKHTISMNRLPIVIVLGSTGTGKTKLSVELAKKFNGEVISADSMQVYKDLSIVTAKTTVEEQAGVPHHLIDFLDTSKSFSVVDFRHQALEIISDQFGRGKIPIVAGGTNYYIEALLWETLISQFEEGLVSDNYDDIIWKDLEFIDKSIDNQSLHDILTSLDPEIAHTLHPNNRRKVLRAIQIAKQTGRKMSEHLNDQMAAFKGESKTKKSLRFPNCVIFWLQCDQDILDQRLDSRVDEMVRAGLLDELKNFHVRFNEKRLNSGTNKAADYTKGIFQTIGFKELHEYLIAMNDCSVTNEHKAGLLERGIKNMKTATRRYARKQIKWIKNHFLGVGGRQMPPVYALNCSDVSQWRTEVIEKSFSILEFHMKRGFDIPNTQFDCINEQSFGPDQEKNDKISDKTKFVCRVCNTIFIGSHQYGIHKSSNKHRNKVHRNIEKCLKKRLETNFSNN